MRATRIRAGLMVVLVAVSAEVLGRSAHPAWWLVVLVVLTTLTAIGTTHYAISEAYYRGQNDALTRSDGGRR